MLQSFKGIKFYIYDLDHGLPHYHAIHGNDSVKIELESLRVVAGSLPPAKLRDALKIGKKNKDAWIEEYNRINKK